MDKIFANESRQRNWRKFSSWQKFPGTVYAYLSTTYPHSKVDLFVPLWVFLIPNNLSLFLMAGEGDSAVGINVILVYRSNLEYTLDLLKVTSVHLRQVLTMKDAYCQCGRLKSSTKWTKQISTIQYYNYGQLASQFNDILYSNFRGDQLSWIWFSSLAIVCMHKGAYFIALS